MVIVGVGNDKFDAMEMLDSDKCALRHPISGEVASR